MQLINSKAYTASGDQKVKEVYVSVGQKVAKGGKLIRSGPRMWHKAVLKRCPKPFSNQTRPVQAPVLLTHRA